MNSGLAGTNLEHTRVFNRRVVLEAIRLHGPISRAHIARLTSLMFQTVSNIVADYIKHDLVRPLGRTNGGRGQPAILLALNSDAAFTYGFQLDRHQIRGVLVDLAGQVRAREVVWCDAPVPSFVLPRLVEMADELRQQAGVAERAIIGAGVALPGPLDPVDYTTAALNFLGWEGFRLRDRLQELLSLPVHLERDAAAAAMGERLHGGGRDYRSFFHLTFLGIGLGGSMILDGQPYRGHSGYAGEIGHYLTMHGGPACACGSHGCLETYVSLGALFDHLGSPHSVPGAMHDLAQRAAAGDPELYDWLDQAAVHLLPAMVMLDNMLEVDAIFFGGLMPGPAVDYLIAKLQAALPAYRMRGKRSYPALLQATSGEDAAVLGAAVLPVFEALAPNPGLLLKRQRGPSLRPEESALTLGM